jgi:hypothetical protein
LPGATTFDDAAPVQMTSGDPFRADPELIRRMGPPENEIPVALAQNTLLARTPDMALALLRLQVYSTGLGFALTVRVRSADRLPGRGLGELFFGPRPGPSGFLLGLELADGRRLTSAAHPWPGDPGDVVFCQAGGSGGQVAVDQSWWLSPLPPPGPLRLVVRCDALGIPETATELDGAAITAAAAEVVELWPWGPPDPEPVVPPPPDVPPDSWFAR